jgi:hypothetical protein
MSNASGVLVLTDPDSTDRHRRTFPLARRLAIAGFMAALAA